KALEQTQTYLNQEGDAHFETLKDLDQEQVARNQTRQALETTQANLLKTQGESSSLRNELAEVRETLDHTHEEYFETLEDQQHQSDQDILDVANAYQGELEELKNILNKTKQEQTRNQKIREFGEGLSKGVLISSLIILAEESDNLKE